jgi:hypothetical protein
MSDENNVLLLITEEYGYQHWMAVLSQTEFDAAVARWKTMKGLHCLVPVPLLFPQAKLASREELVAADEEAVLSGDKVVTAHVHQADDSHIAGVVYEIPEAENFEIDGKVYSEDEINDIFQAHKREISREKEQKVELPPMPTRTVTQLILLKNRLIDVETEVFGIRQKIDIILDELITHLEHTKQIEFKEV